MIDPTDSTGSSFLHFIPSNLASGHLIVWTNSPPLGGRDPFTTISVPGAYSTVYVIEFSFTRLCVQLQGSLGFNLEV